MKTSLDCIPCFMRQALDAARMVSDDVKVHEEVMRRVMAGASRMDLRRPPPVMGQTIHRIIRQVTGVEDPYREVKERFNRFALGLYDGLRERVESSADPFETAVRLSIAGNVIDFGLKSRVRECDVERGIEEALVLPVAREEIETLRSRVSQARNVLYLADNAGEIVFDRLLIERLAPAKVTVAVKAGPVINDATRVDAEAAGLNGRVEVIDNGSDAPGTVLTDVSPEFLERFNRADVVIAKGQGNYETLSEADREVFFLLKAKCAVIADDIGCETGSVIVARQSAPTRAAE